MHIFYTIVREKQKSCKDLNSNVKIIKIITTKIATIHNAPYNPKVLATTVLFKKMKQQFHFDMGNIAITFFWARIIRFPALGQNDYIGLTVYNTYDSYVSEQTNFFVSMQINTKALYIYSNRLRFQKIL